MSKRYSHGINKVPKLHSLTHPDVSDNPLSVKAFAEECRKIVEQVEEDTVPSPYDYKDLLEEPVAGNMDMNTEMFEELKQLME